MSPEEASVAQDGKGPETDSAHTPGMLVDEHGVLLTPDESKKEMEDRLDGSWRDGLK